MTDISQPPQGSMGNQLYTDPNKPTGTDYIDSIGNAATQLIDAFTKAGQQQAQGNAQLTTEQERKLQQYLEAQKTTKSSTNDAPPTKPWKDEPIVWVGATALVLGLGFAGYTYFFAEDGE